MGGVGRWRRSLGKHWSSLILILIRSKADEGFVNLCPSGFFVKLDNFVNAASFRQIQNNARWLCGALWHGCDRKVATLQSSVSVTLVGDIYCHLPRIVSVFREAERYWTQQALWNTASRFSLSFGEDRENHKYIVIRYQIHTLQFHFNDTEPTFAY